jgi:hypothetical protein
MVVYVMKKLAEHIVPSSRLLPRRIYSGRDYIEVDVVETGPFYPLSFTTRDRPSPSGVSIGNANEASAGTFGSLVIDNSDKSLCVLSNNHVLARENAAALGEAIVQQGIFDGSTSPADDIATLKNFIMINATGNSVDCAIGQVNDPALVIDQMKNNLMPVPSKDHPAVGLLFAGSCNRTTMNPIDKVLGALNISFPAGAGSTITPDIGMNVEKVGRTTEYTTSTIKEIDATITLAYDFGNATFDGQIQTAKMSDRGDSGSVVCRGGEGGDVDDCSACGSTSAASRILGQNLDLDAALQQEVRDKFLNKSLLGRYATELYFQNERNILRRVRSAKINESDQAFIRYLYNSYIEQARMAVFQVNDPNVRLTEDHYKDIHQALSRSKPYLTNEEYETAAKLVEMGRRAIGLNGREILRMLDDENLFDEIFELLSRVRTLEQPEGFYRSRRDKQGY